MASLIFDSFLDDTVRGNVDWDSDTFYGMLVTSSYTPNKGTHTKRSDVTNEVSGTGYSAGGAATAITVTKDASGHIESMAHGDISWATSTITARALVVYKRRGGASSADELVCYIDFGGDKTSTGGTFTFHETTALTITN